MDDYISPLTVEAYTENRMRTLLDHYEQQAPFLAATLRIIEMVNIGIMASGTMLASLNLEVPPYRTHAADGSKRNGPKRTHASRHLRCGWRWSFSSVAQ